MVGCLGGIAYAQAIFNATQTKINNDLTSISLDQSDIAVKNAEIQSLEADPAYNVAQNEATAASVNPAPTQPVDNTPQGSVKSGGQCVQNPDCVSNDCLSGICQ